MTETEHTLARIDGTCVCTCGRHFHSLKGLKTHIRTARPFESNLTGKMVFHGEGK